MPTADREEALFAAALEHPHIAKVFDAGTTDSGRPYFVMELVKVLPLTNHCDEHQLSPRERLELFIPVCQAIQHAHQKGVIQRDIKPSNILVASYDGRAVPKVIDFGLAGQGTPDRGPGAGGPIRRSDRATGAGREVAERAGDQQTKGERNQEVIIHRIVSFD